MMTLDTTEDRGFNTFRGVSILQITHGVLKDTVYTQLIQFSLLNSLNSNTLDGLVFPLQIFLAVLRCVLTENIIDNTLIVYST